MRRRYTVIVVAVVACLLVVGAVRSRTGAGSRVAFHGPAGRVFVLTALPGSRPVLQVAARDGASGRLLHTTTIRLPSNSSSFSPLDTGHITVDRDRHHGRLIVTERDSALIYGFDVASGRLLWTTSVGPPHPSPKGQLLVQSSLVDDWLGRLFVRDQRMGVIRTLDTRSGRLLYTLHVPPGGSDLAAVHKTGRIFVFYGGHVRVLNAVSQRVLYTRTIGRMYDYGPGVVDQRTGRVFLSDFSTGSVVVLDGRTGRIMHVVPVGHDPTLPVVDAKTGRVHVWITGPVRRNGTLVSDHTVVLDGHSGAILSMRRGNVGGVFSDQAVGPDHEQSVHSWQDALPDALRRAMWYLIPRSSGSSPSASERVIFVPK